MTLCVDTTYEFAIYGNIGSYTLQLDTNMLKQDELCQALLKWLISMSADVYEEMVTIDVLTDRWAEETTWWELRKTITGEVRESRSHRKTEDGETQFYFAVCVEQGESYAFTIFDTANEVICCGYGLGSYTVMCSRKPVKTNGGEFGASETTIFDVPDTLSAEPSFAPTESNIPSVEPSSEPSTELSDNPTVTPMASSRPSSLPSL